MLTAAVEPAWEMKTGSAVVDQTGGEVKMSEMSITIEPGVFSQESEIKVYHYRPVETQDQTDKQECIEGQVIQRGDSIIVEVSARAVEGSVEASPGSSPSGTTIGTACVELTLPNGFTEEFLPQMFLSTPTSGGRQNFKRVTDTVKPRLVKNPRTGVLSLIFEVICTAVKTVYELVWVPAKAVAERIGAHIEQALNVDDEPLYIRVHYRCDDDGYPCQLITVIAAGDPPAPEEEEDLEDGLFTAELVKGRHHLDNQVVSSRSHVVVKLAPFDPLALRLEKQEYTFRKRPNKCRRHYKRVSVHAKVSPAGVRTERWELELQAEKDKNNVTGGSVILAVQRQVSMRL